MYAITGAAFTLLLLLLQAIVFLMRYLRPWLVLLRTHLVHALTLPPRFLPWSWTYAQVLLLLIYLAANVLCCYFDISTAQGASIRAARLSILNLIPIYFGPHFSFLCDLSGVSLHTYRIFHGLAATISLLLGLTHVVIDVVQSSTLNESGSLRPYGTIVSYSSQCGAPLMTPHTDNYGNKHHFCTLLSSFCYSRVRGFPSLSPNSSYRSPLQSMETCPLKKSRDLHTSGQLYLRIYTGFGDLPHPVSKRCLLSHRLPSLDFKTQRGDQNDYICYSTLEA
jgi:hypothetical protein